MKNHRPRHKVLTLGQKNHHLMRVKSLIYQPIHPASHGSFLPIPSGPQSTNKHEQHSKGSIISDEVRTWFQRRRSQGDNDNRGRTTAQESQRSPKLGWLLDILWYLSMDRLIRCLRVGSTYAPDSRMSLAELRNSFAADLPPPAGQVGRCRVVVHEACYLC